MSIDKVNEGIAIFIVLYTVTQGIIALLVMKVYLWSARRIRKETCNAALEEAARVAEEWECQDFIRVADIQKEIVTIIRKLKQE